MTVTGKFFNDALDRVFGNEGGYVNDPDDPGGPTNFGITQATLSSWIGRPASPEDVQNLTRAQAARIYADRFWRPLGLDRLTQYPVAAALFDIGVLFGIGAAAICAQKALSRCGYPALVIDGHLGSESVKALNEVDSLVFISTLHLVLSAKISNVIAQRPSSEKYRRGWDSRVDRLLTLTT